MFFLYFLYVLVKWVRGLNLDNVLLYYCLDKCCRWNKFNIILLHLLTQFLYSVICMNLCLLKPWLSEIIEWRNYKTEYLLYGLVGRWAATENNFLEKIFYLLFFKVAKNIIACSVIGFISSFKLLMMLDVNVIWN